MKKYLKWLGILLVTILAIAAIAVFYLKSKFESLDGRKFEPNVSAITIPTDSASIERGRVLTVMCKHCHGDDYSGKAFFNDPKIGFMASANISSAKGSATEKYTDLDWVRTLRHGVNPSHRALMVMPAEDIGLLGDQDLGCLIAYMKTIKPVEKVKAGLSNTQIETYSELKRLQMVLDVAKIDIFGTMISGIRAFFNRLNRL